MSYKQTIDNAIADNKVVVFSKSYCPFCRATKTLLDSLDANAKVFELDEINDGADWQAYLADKTGQRTVPNVFVSQKHIGGNSDLQTLNSKGELKQLIAA